MSSVLVVGGGIAGLSAAYRLRQRGHDVLVLEGAPRPGGKLARAVVAGVPVDVGAEAMLNRRPEGVALARELGLTVVHPAIAKSHIFSRGALRPLPRSLMGIPLDYDELVASGVLSDAGLAAVRAEPTLERRSAEDDVAVGDLVADRFGDEVVDRLVEPLLGGVYAGHSRLISARAAMPQLLALAARGSLMDQAAAIPTTYDAPVFACVEGGMGRFAETLAATVPLRTQTPVRRLARTAGGFEVTVGSAADPERLRADAVVLAVPAAPAARLLGDLAPIAAELLTGIESASVAVVTFAFRRADLDDSAIPHSGSGFLVPPIEDLSIKASTFSFAKWHWVADAGRGAGPEGEDLAFLRTSLGRHREVVTLQRSDEALVELSLADLARCAGLRAQPIATHVQRWGGGLPQYALGHVERVAAVRAEVARVPGLAVCGAAYDGVGIPAVIASAEQAVEALAQYGP